MRHLATIDANALATVVGGAELSPAMNIDKTQSKIGIARVGDIPIPYRTTTTKKVRTELGNCIDGGFAACERRGGTNETVGSCMLDAVKTCSKRDE